MTDCEIYCKIYVDKLSALVKNALVMVATSPLPHRLRAKSPRRERERAPLPFKPGDGGDSFWTRLQIAAVEVPLSGRPVRRARIGHAHRAAQSGDFQPANSG